jgi:hypothetical protein
MERAVIIKADGTKSVVQFEVGKSYQLLSDTVDGMIDCVRLPSREADMWVNDEGKLLGLPQNPIATALWADDYGVTDVILGDVILTNVNNEGDTVGLSNEQVEGLLAYDKAISLLF